MFSTLLAVLVIAAIVGYFAARNRAYAVAGDKLHGMHSLPSFHGANMAIWVAIPAFLVMCVWAVVSPRVIDGMVLSQYSDAVAGLSTLEVNSFLRDARAIAFGGIASFPNPEREAAAETISALAFANNVIMAAVIVTIAVCGGLFAWGRITYRARARHHVEGALKILLMVCSAVAIMTTIGIVMSLIFESIRFFGKVPFQEFLFGLHWSPQTALRADQVGSSGAFGAIPLFVGTLLITVIAISVAAPVGLLAAIYLSDYAGPKFRAVAKPVLEILAGVPTVVYGFFAALTVAPFFRNTGESMGLTVSSESALAAGVVMGIMLIPFVSSLSDDVINAVPQSLRDGSAGLGATKSETIRKVILPAALPGIVSALLLAVSRAIGETMIVVMAAGLAANLTINPLEAVTTVTVQIVTLLVGDQEFDSAKTLAAFALGLVLFCVTLCLNFVALRVVQKYREQYD